MKYEIINPSDGYTIEHGDFAVVCVATLALGMGGYGLSDPATGKTVMPVMVFGVDDDWFMTTFNTTLENLLQTTDRSAVADALESVTLATDKRTSMNDIGAKAHAIAAQIRGEPSDADR